MFKTIVKIVNSIRFGYRKVKKYVKTQMLKAIGKDPAFNPDALEWQLGPVTKKSESMRRLCLRMMLGIETVGEVHSPVMAPTESAYMFDDNTIEGTMLSVNAKQHGKTTMMKFTQGVWTILNYVGTPECLISHNELPFVNGEPTHMSDAYAGAYATKTKPILAMMKRFYEDNVYCFRNVKYTAEELQSVIIGFAMGRLPLGYFKYWTGERYISNIPENPAEGAVIVTMPNYETFATFTGGMWELNLDIMQTAPNHIQVNSRILPYIAGKPTVTCYYEVQVVESEPTKLGQSFGAGYAAAQSHKYN